jgi:hypothetical protein
MTDTQELLQKIEPVVDEILAAFDVDRPPVPVELMLQRPRENTWPEIDLSEMSVTFLSLHDRYAPRMSAVRLLARNIARSEWGQQRGLTTLLIDTHTLNVFARALLVPKSLLDKFDKEVHEKTAISFRFELPEDDAQARLEDMEYE